MPSLAFKSESMWSFIFKASLFIRIILGSNSLTFLTILPFGFYCNSIWNCFIFVGYLRIAYQENVFALCGASQKSALIVTDNKI